MDRGVRRRHPLAEGLRAASGAHSSSDTEHDSPSSSRLPLARGQGLVCATAIPLCACVDSCTALAAAWLPGVATGWLCPARSSHWARILYPLLQDRPSNRGRVRGTRPTRHTGSHPKLTPRLGSTRSTLANLLVSMSRYGGLAQAHMRVCTWS